MIEVSNLKKCFGSVKAIDGVSFTAKDGCITGLLGPNGAGKSTTLRVLYTAYQPDSGKALIDNLDVTIDKVAVRTSIGVLTHGAGIYERLSARENIRYFGELHGMSGKELRNRIDYLSDLLDMNDFIERRTKGFSQGQKTKVALARALAHRPSTIMLDEPTNGLDVMATRGLRDILRNLAADGHCILFSSHIMQEVAALCDHIAIIADGKIAMADNFDAILHTTGKDNLEDAFVTAIGEAA